MDLAKYLERQMDIDLISQSIRTGQGSYGDLTIGIYRGQAKEHGGDNKVSAVQIPKGQFQAMDGKSSKLTSPEAVETLKSAVKAAVEKMGLKDAQINIDPGLVITDGKVELVLDTAAKTVTVK